MPSVTIHDVAKAAGVSIATVSYVLNNSRRIGGATRERVLQVVDELGYRPNITAQNLQASETRLFGYSWHPSSADEFNPILDRFLHALAEAAARHGYRVLTAPTTSLQAEIRTYEEMVLIGQVDGFVLSNTNTDDQRIRSLLDAGFPFVAFGRSNPEWNFPWVDVDGRAGVRVAVEHLIERGHRRIACLAWPPDSLTGTRRLEGYGEAMGSAGLPVAPAWIERAHNDHDDAYASTRRLLALPAAQRPSALVAMSDLMAMGAINAAWDAGLEVGRDLALVGFDDAQVARYLRPPLSSVQQPIAEVGERLVDMLVSLCQGRRLSESHVLLRPELVVRASSNTPYLETGQE